MSGKDSIQSWPMRYYDFQLPVRYHLTEPKGDGVVICLHGYQDHALSMLRRIGWWSEEPPFQVLAINGPFPVPLWTKHGFIEAYSWYFRDTQAHIMLVQPWTTAQTLGGFLNEIGLENTPKVLFGFSQGGYMASYMAAKFKNVRGIIGYGTGYNAEAYAQLPPLTVHAIHGDADERIPIENARRDFQNILQYGHTGAFHEIPALTHKVETSVEPLVRQLAQQMFQVHFAGRRTP
jgi:predicted esterase